MRISELDIEVEHKEIKNIHLAVYPPDGRVHISVPNYMKDDEVSMFLFTKLSWIRRQREEVLMQERQDEREYISGESHYLFGRRYLLKVRPTTSGRVFISKKVKYLEMYVRSDSSVARRKMIMEDFYRSELRPVLDSIVSKWSIFLDENISSFEWSILLMQNQWGSCITASRKIQFNLLLARMPLRCIEYIVVHEMLHLKEHRHNKDFVTMLDNYLPDWQLRKKELDEFIALPAIE